jgi:hypothetical protein
MVEGNLLRFKYITVPADNISGWRASSIRTIFNCRGNIERRKVSEITNRNSKTNSFQDGRTDFKTEVNLSEEQCVKVISHLSKVWSFKYSRPWVLILLSWRTATCNSTHSIIIFLLLLFRSRLCHFSDGGAWWHLCFYESFKYPVLVINPATGVESEGVNMTGWATEIG